jgi:hypothetical protein
MTGYQSKRAAAQDKLNDDALLIAYQSGYYDGKKAAQAKVEGPLHVVCQCDKCKAQPAQEPNWAWACNECGAQEFTSALCEADLDYLACSNCGGDEFHKEALEQPAQEPVAWGVDWGKAGDIPCVSIIKRLPNGSIEVMAVEYAPYSYTTPPQRPWVDLTDEDIALIDWESLVTKKDLVQAIEAKLKEMNT